MSNLVDLLRRLTGSALPEPPRLPATAPPRSAVEPLLDEAQVPGATLARIEDGEVRWVAGYGRCQASPFSAPVNADTTFQAASVSKTVTALMVLRLVQQGRLDLDTDVRPLLAYDIPEHPMLSHQRSPRRPITARLLLQHRAGIAGRGTTPSSEGSGFRGARVGGGSLRVANHRGARVPSLATSWRGTERSLPVMCTYPPGTAVSYSGAGYLVLQHLIEQVTGRSFAAVADSLFEAFGLRFATFDLRPPSDRTLAHGHDTAGRELPGGHELVPWSAAGGLFVTGTSLAELLAAMVRGGDGVIDAELIEMMFARQLGVFAPTIGGHRAFRHGGDNTGFRASITGIPALGVGAVVLTNGRTNHPTDGATLRRRLAADVLDLD